MFLRFFTRHELDQLIFAVLLLLFLIPVWCVDYPPLQDAPAYLVSAQVVYQWGDPVLGQLYREYYKWAPTLTTNWASHAILIALLTVFPPLAALKVLLSFYVLLLPLAARYAFRALNPEPGPAGLLIFPFLFTVVFQYGFLNFSFGLALFFLMTGYLLRHRLRFGVRTVTVVLIFSIVGYLTHLVALMMSAVSLVVIGAWSLVSLGKAKSKGHVGGAQTVSRKILLAVLAILPGFALGTRLIGGNSWLFRNEGWRGALAGIARAVDDLLLLRPMISVASHQRYLVALLLLLFALMAAYVFWSRYREAHLEARDAVVALPIAYTGAYLAACGWLGTDLFLVPRLVLFPYFGLMIWLAAYTYPRRLQHVIRALIVTVSLGLLVTTILAFVRIEPTIKEYMSAAEVIPPRATLLGLSFDSKGHYPTGEPISYRSLVFLHTHGYISAENGCLNLTNYQAGRSFFPINYRPERSPYVHIAPIDTIESLPNWVDFRNYPARSGGRIDFVLTWCLPDEDADPRVRFIKEQLQEGFVEAYVSPRRLVRVFRSKAYRE